MDITPLVPQGHQIIQSYASGRFRVSGQVYAGGVIVFPDQTILWKDAKPISDLGGNDFSVILAHAAHLDVILVGCGAALGAMPFSLRRALKDLGVSAEFMDTGAACRTYNVLMAEGRRVVAALLPTE